VGHFGWLEGLSYCSERAFQHSAGMPPVECAEVQFGVLACRWMHCGVMGPCLICMHVHAQYRDWPPRSGVAGRQVRAAHRAGVLVSVCNTEAIQV
jgi:hypothetical protein